MLKFGMVIDACNRILKRFIMKNVLFFLLFVGSSLSIQAQSKYIKGKLTHFEAPLANAEVIVKNSDVKVKTKVDGT